MKPFVLIDTNTEEIIFVIQNIAKRIKIKNINMAEDFINEFYRRFKNVNVVLKYNTMGRKDFLDLMDGFKTNEIKKEDRKVELREKNEEVKEENKELENSTLIRSNTERKITIEDLGLRFDAPYDYYDLSAFDEKKVKQSAQLKYFMNKNLIVKTTMDEISALRTKITKAKEDLDNKRREAVIIDRHAEGSDSNEGMLISSDQYKNAGSNQKSVSNSEINSDDLTNASQEIFDRFSGDGILGGSQSDSIDKLMKNF